MGADMISRGAHAKDQPKMAGVYKTLQVNRKKIAPYMEKVEQPCPYMGAPPSGRWRAVSKSKGWRPDPLGSRAREGTWDVGAPGTLQYWLFCSAGAIAKVRRENGV